MTTYKCYVPHSVDIMNQKGEIVTYKSIGSARRTESFSYYYKDGFRFLVKSFGEVVGLPEPEENVVYIVSACVLDYVIKFRDDCVSPDIGVDCLRKDVGKDKGKVSAVRGFVSGRISEYNVEPKPQEFYISEYNTKLEISVPKEHLGYNYLDIFIICGDFETQTCFNITDNEFTSSLDLPYHQIRFLEEFIENQVRLALMKHF